MGATTHESWHLSRSVPITLIATIAIQTCAIVWWASAISTRVDAHDTRILEIENVNRQTANELRRATEVIARLDERIVAQTAILARIEVQLSRHNPQGVIQR